MNTGTICFLFDQFHIYCLPDVNTRRSTESADERSPKQIQYLFLFENVLLKTTVSSYFRKLFSLEKQLFDNTLKKIYILSTAKKALKSCVFISEKVDTVFKREMAMYHETCTHLSAQVPGLFGHLINGWVQWITFLFPASLWKEAKVPC